MNYQEKVNTRADVQALYEKVKANPAIARYRGYTDNKSYGWDEVKGDYIKAEREVWFENPSFAPGYVTEGAPDEAATELLDEQLSACRTELAGLQEALVRLQNEKDELKNAKDEARALAKEALAERDGAIALAEELRATLAKIAALVEEKLGTNK